MPVPSGQFSMTSGTPPADGFTLSGADPGFGSRSRNVFSLLETLEAKHVATQKVQSESQDDQTLVKPDPVDDTIRDRKRPNFRKPARAAPRSRRNRPDHSVNPEKWTFYDLSSVSSDQMSDTANAAAALDFLQTRREQAATTSQEDNPDVDLTSDKPTFSLRKREIDEDSKKSAVETSEYRAGKYIMPEYNFGQSDSRRKAKKAKVTTSQTDCNTVGLGHVIQEEQDDSVKDGLHTESRDDNDEQTETAPVSFKSKKGRSKNIRKRQSLESDEDN